MANGVASLLSISQEALLRGWMAVNSMRRIAASPEPLDALETERRHFASHRRAQARRRAVAGAVDGAAEVYGSQLGWYAKLDDRTTPDCRGAHGQNFQADTPPLLGYPGAVHLNCFPAGTVVSGPPVDASVTRWYEGDVLEIGTVSGRFVTVTPNHPILTSEGWVAAGLLNKSSYLACCFDPERMTGDVYPDEYQVPAFIEDVAGSVGASFGMSPVSMPTSALDFHGDGVGSEVCVVRSDGLLGHRFDSELVLKPHLQERFGRGDMDLPFFLGASHLALGSKANSSTSGRVMGSFSVPAMLCGRPARHHKAIGLFNVADGYTSLPQSRLDHLSTCREGLGQGVDRLSALVGGDDFLDGQVDSSHVRLSTGGLRQGAALGGGALQLELVQVLTESVATDTSAASSVFDTLAGYIELDRVIKVSKRFFRGHVYNLQTVDGWYTANEIITHNCRCKPGPPWPNGSMLS